MKGLYKSVVSLAASAALLVTGITSVTATAESKVMVGYPVYMQSGNNCWAYAVLSMNNFLTGINYQVEYVYGTYITVTGNTYVNNSGANLDECYGVINYLLSSYSPTKINDDMAFSLIKSKVNASLPSLIGGYYYGNPGSVTGHAVVLIGYSDWTNSDGSRDTSIYYMNPATGAIENYPYNTNATTQFFKSGSRIFNWSNAGSVYLN